MSEEFTLYKVDQVKGMPSSSKNDDPSLKEMCVHTSWLLKVGKGHEVPKTRAEVYMQKILGLRMTDIGDFKAEAGGS